MRREHKDIWNRICLVYEKKKIREKKRKGLEMLKRNLDEPKSSGGGGDTPQSGGLDIGGLGPRKLRRDSSSSSHSF
jgi:hypothetical protein